MEANLELAISHNSTRKLCIEILLVCHPSTKLFLPQHLSEGDLVIISVDSDDFARLTVVSLKLNTVR